MARDVVKATWTEKSKKAWGGFKPTITLEYDARNSYMLSLELHYNKAKASKGQAYDAKLLIEKLHDDMDQGNFYEETEVKASSNARGETSFGNRGNPDFVDNFGGVKEEEDKDDDQGAADDAGKKKK